VTVPFDYLYIEMNARQKAFNGHGGENIWLSVAETILPTKSKLVGAKWEEISFKVISIQFLCDKSDI
jgi:hypothetical protein